MNWQIDRYPVFSDVLSQDLFLSLREQACSVSHQLPHELLCILIGKLPIVVHVASETSKLGLPQSKRHIQWLVLMPVYQKNLDSEKSIKKKQLHQLPAQSLNYQQSQISCSCESAHRQPTYNTMSYLNEDEQFRLRSDPDLGRRNQPQWQSHVSTG
ncbi:hypothetical protein FGO68_gene9898 [Halteria grandinella]|uniref:Uncharacterized protein n=1 Tax=Halteria grandinella TaxID=5974 RepID=A0A8J8N9C9_HALGN|nr:hypothetical protein FGO68_gene9898 [Halteria grandinella]